MEFLRAIVVCSFFFSFAMRSEKAMATLTPSQFPAIYNFGDSNSDTGGMSAAFFPPVAPFGDTFFKRPSGRDCDGRLIIDFIVDRLKYPFLNAYLDSIGTNFRHGANFASNHALVCRINESYFERGMSPFPLDIQVEQFVQFKDRSAYFYQLGQDMFRLPIPEEFANALYIIDIGQNDIAFGFSAKQSDQEIISSFPDIMNQIALAVKKLYELGARTFWIFNTGPIGCLPISTVSLKNMTHGTLDPQGCIKSQNDVALVFNKQLKDKIVVLRTQLDRSNLTYVDIYATKYGLISNASSLGFMSPSTICCGYYDNEIRMPCGTNSTVNSTEIYAGSCINPLKVISWDGVHYSEASNSYVANQIFTNPSLSDPSI